MKLTKRILSMVLLLVLVFALSATAMAADPTYTITIENPTLGSTYEVYKILDAQVDSTGKKVTYTVNSDSKWYDFFKDDSSLFTVAQIGTTKDYYVSLRDQSTTADAYKTFANSIKAKLDSNEKVGTTNKTFKELVDSSKVATKASIQATDLTNGKLVISGLTSGYYYVNTKSGTVVTLDTVNGTNITVYDKNPTQPGPIPDPQNDETPTAYKTVDDNTLAVGATANFTIQFNATNFYTVGGNPHRIKEYVIKDVATNIDSDLTTATVTVDGKAVAAANITKEAGKITLKWATCAKNPETTKNEDWSNIYNSAVPVVITYTGVVKGTASSSTNTATISYSTVDGTETPELSKTVTITNYTAQITKTNVYKETEDRVVLSGAKFKIYSSNEAGAEALFVRKNSDGDYTLYDGVTTVPENEKITEMETDNNGVLKIQGLCGTYYLEETESPSGYVRKSTREAITVNEDTSTSGVYAYDFQNSEGTELPTTGGVGTTLFYVFGSLLVVGAAVLFITKKRTEE